MVIVVMGVAGAGKTTVGRQLAETLGWEFVEGDDFHSAANRDKMRSGIPLTDADRAPWLAALRAHIAQCLSAGRNAVLASSALKASYRDSLRVDPERIRFVYLKASPELVAERLATRRGHYMNPSLLPSQFDTLEEPSDAVTVDAALPTTDIVAAIRLRLHL